MTILNRHWRAKVLEIVFRFLDFHLDLSGDVGQAMLNVGEENLSQLGGQIVDAQQALRHRRVHWMGTEIQLLLFDGLLHRNTIDDVLLRPILDSNKTKAQVHIFSLNHPFSICSLVHDINLCDYSDSSYTLWVNLPSHLQAIRGSHISVRRKSTQNNGP